MSNNKTKEGDDPKKDAEADKDSYFGRVKHYFGISNPIHLLATDESLNKARDIVKTPTKAAKQLRNDLSEAEIKSAERLYDSAYHPLTGERRPWITRLAAQPLLRAITLGGMLAYQETVPQIIFWQWLHQTMMSTVDYYNRGSVPASEIGCAYSASTVGAVATALALNKSFRCSGPLTKRLIPLAAVTVGQAINVPMIKNRDICDGVAVETKARKPVGISKKAGFQSTLNSALNRVLQMAPALVLAPLVLNNLEKKNKFCKQPTLEVAYAIGLTGIIMFISLPLVLACISPDQRAPIKTEVLEDNIKKAVDPAKEPFLYYNRDLL